MVFENQFLKGTTFPFDPSYTLQPRSGCAENNGFEKY